MKKIYLLPGKVAASAEAAEITTILGSCVAVALHDPMSKVGGLNHFLLPELPPGEPPSGRYGDSAIPELIRMLDRLGANRSHLLAKVYGGGNVMSDIASGIGVGNRNVEFAIQTLAELGIPVHDRNVLGSRSRRIVFNTAEFTVHHQWVSEGEQAEPASVRVVIVDDSRTVRSVFKQVFEKAGLIVVGTAGDAFEARELIVRERPDVITLDIEMPSMSGVAFLEKLMKHFPTPVVMVSALDPGSESARKALGFGAVEFVQKPSEFDPQTLRRLAEALVEKLRAAAHPLIRARRSAS